MEERGEPGEVSGRLDADDRSDPCWEEGRGRARIGGRDGGRPRDRADSGFPDYRSHRRHRFGGKTEGARGAGRVLGDLVHSLPVDLEVARRFEAEIRGWDRG